MKNTLILSIAWLVLVSLTHCKQDGHPDIINTLPQWSVDNIKDSYVATKTLRLNLKPGSTDVKYVSFTLNNMGTATTDLLQVVYTGIGTLKIDAQEYATGVSVPVTGKTKLNVTFQPSAAGDYSLIFNSARDTNSGSQTTVKITVTQNSLPTANFNFTPSSTSAYEYYFDAASSTDTDGTIKIYTYTITSLGTTSKTVISNESATHYFFPQNDTYTVSLVVTDSDGGKSAAVTKTVSVR